MRYQYSLNKKYRTNCGAIATIDSSIVRHETESELLSPPPSFEGYVDYRGQIIEVHWVIFGGDPWTLKASRWTNYIVPENELLSFPFDIDLHWEASVVCECGADKIEVDSHSPWCPRFTR